jgi:uncharacterized protein YbjQ (UPF0145 family)
MRQNGGGEYYLPKAGEYDYPRQQTTIKWDGSVKKLSCELCGAIFKHEKIIKDHTYVLKKIESPDYMDSFKEVMKRQTNQVRGLRAEEWDNIATGGYTDEELEKLKGPKLEEQERKLQAQKEHQFKSMITVTTPTIEGRMIEDYKGIVSGQVVAGINFFKDAFAGIRDVIGGRSKKLQQSMVQMREAALNEMKEEAMSRGANAIIGVSFDFDEYGEKMLILSSTGTAVKLR